MTLPGDACQVFSRVSRYFLGLMVAGAIIVDTKMKDSYESWACHMFIQDGCRSKPGYCGESFDTYEQLKKTT